MLEHYLDEIGREPLLGAEEELSLARRVQCGDAKARERMIKANLRLVVKIAAEFTNRGVPLADLVSEGNLGLIKAVDRFRPGSGAKFSTYSSWWIREAVHRCLCTQSRVVRLPATALSKIGKLRRVAAMMSTELGRDPEASELAEELGMPVDSVERWEAAARSNASLDEPIGGEEGFSLAATLRDETRPAADELMFDAETCAQTMGLLDALSAREKRIVEMRYGLDGQEVRTLEQVSVEFGCTRERVRQIQDIALRKLRRAWQRRDTFAQLDRPAA
jgi:RNA polymerase primary sigma factor